MNERTPSDTRTLRVIVVDDHEAVRAGVQAVLAREPDLQPVGGASGADQALDKARARRPDVAVVDHRLEAGDGLTLTRQLKALPDPPAVLIYSAHADAALTVAAVVAGADGVVGKGADADDLCDAVRFVGSGRSVRPKILPGILRSTASRLDPADVPILGMLVHRTPPSEIARVLDISERRLDARRWAMLRRLTGGERRASARARRLAHACL
ncbi:MAG TPA: response regulator transcription factor [Thermoleophilaceae bacterium]|nr:response regulator transcription factor [Thermoleophilaceae bacterium]